MVFARVFTFIDHFCDTRYEGQLECKGGGWIGYSEIVWRFEKVVCDNHSTDEDLDTFDGP